MNAATQVETESGMEGGAVAAPPPGWISAEKEKELLNRIEYLKRARKEEAGDWERVNSNLCQSYAATKYMLIQAHISLEQEKERSLILEEKLEETEARLRAAKKAPPKKKSKRTQTVDETVCIPKRMKFPNNVNVIIHPIVPPKGFYPASAAVNREQVPAPEQRTAVRLPPIF